MKCDGTIEPARSHLLPISQDRFCLPRGPFALLALCSIPILILIQGPRHRPNEGRGQGGHLPTPNPSTEGSSRGDCSPIRKGLPVGLGEGEMPNWTSSPLDPWVPQLAGGGSPSLVGCAQAPCRRPRPPVLGSVCTCPPGIPMPQGAQREIANNHSVTGQERDFERHERQENVSEFSTL